MQYNFPMPPTLLGSEAEQLVQLHRYLFRMNEQLNAALAAESVVVQDIATQQRQAIKASDLDEGLAGQYNRAKALVIKTAEEVRHEMDRIVAELDEKYVARSEWGTYRESVSQEIEATAKSVVQSFD